MEITCEEVRRRFKYDRKLGVLVRRFNSGKAKAGTHSTAKDRDGYLVVGINKKLYRAHRVVWLYVYGKWPDADIDHINGIKHDNRISNLRDITRSRNKQNQKAQKNNKCGFKGVWLHKQTGRWCATICHLGKKIHIGSFETIQEAAQAYAEKAAELHEFNPSAKKQKGRVNTDV